MAAPNQITQAQLNRLIGTPDAPTILDVRIDEDFAQDPRMIPSAQRRAFTDAEKFASEFVGKNVVVSCHKGLKLSQGVTAILNAHGVAAEYLQDGHVGWAEANLTLIKPSPSGTTWVTRHRPKIDRIACPWLIRRFIDPAATFLFVAPSQVNAVAEKFNAIAFDVPDCDWTHHGDLCTFDALLEGFGLQTPTLTHMARIIRAADTNTLSSEPEAAGLHALSLGLSRIYRNDLEQLENGLLLYDALYRWARDATDETHIWDAAK